MEWIIAVGSCLLIYYGVIKNSQKKQNIRYLENRQSSLAKQILYLRAKESEKRALYNQTFCSIDTETTGLVFAESKIIQVALVLFKNGKRVGSRSWMINPGVKIPVNATKVNKITNEMLEDKPRFAEIKEELSRLIQKYPLVGHNLSFDHGMLEHEFTRHSMQFSPTILYCTMKATSDIFTKFDRRYRRNQSPWKKLGSLANEFGIQPKGNLHDALVDADLAGKIYITMLTIEADNFQSERILAQQQMASVQSEISSLKK